MGICLCLLKFEQPPAISWQLAAAGGGGYAWDNKTLLRAHMHALW